VIDEANEKLETSARNLPNVGVIRVAGLNVYDVLRHPKLLLTQAAVEAIEKRLERRRGSRGSEAEEAAS
jgi:large subunit ribosomal protein L4